MAKAHTFVLNLRRENPNEQWGFSLVGGADQGAPLIITRVAFGSPAGSTLQRGDIISKIGNYDARDIRHQDAQNLFRNAGTNVKIVVQRETGRHNTSTASSRCSSHTPLSISPNLSPRGPTAYASPGGSGGAPQQVTYIPTLQPVTSTPFSNLNEGYYREVYQGRKAAEEDIDHVVNQHHPRAGGARVRMTPCWLMLGARSSCPCIRAPGACVKMLLSHQIQHEYSDPQESAIMWPYRTTPLVLPGAKVKRESGATESYLRHHPNPAVRSAPHVIDHEHLMKQRIVHKQFNSPIGMYSDANIVDSIKHQAGLAPKRFDPSLSEAYKALQEEAIGADHRVQEVTVPVQPKVFTPNKIIPGKRPLPTQQPQTPQTFINSMGNTGEVIQQSGSFKRLMYHVMAESSF